jgi:hypothetical protein
MPDIYVRHNLTDNEGRHAVLRRPNPPGRTKTKETEMVMTGRRYRAGHRPKDIPPTEPLHETEIPNGRPKIKPGLTTNGPKTRPTKTPETLMKPRKAIAYERAARHSRPTAAAAATNLLPRLTKRLRATAEVAALLFQQRWVPASESKTQCVVHIYYGL